MPELQLFTVSELLRESQKAGGGKITPSPRLGLTKKIYHHISKFFESFSKVRKTSLNIKTHLNKIVWNIKLTKSI